MGIGLVLLRSRIHRYLKDQMWKGVDNMEGYHSKRPENRVHSLGQIIWICETVVCKKKKPDELNLQELTS